MSKGNLSGHAISKCLGGFFSCNSEKVNFFDALLVMVQNYGTCYLGFVMILLHIINTITV